MLARDTVFFFLSFYSWKNKGYIYLVQCPICQFIDKNLYEVICGNSNIQIEFIVQLWFTIEFIPFLDDGAIQSIFHRSPECYWTPRSFPTNLLSQSKGEKGRGIYSLFI